MTSNDSESEGDASSVSDSSSASSNSGRAASSTLEYPIRGVVLVPSTGKAGTSPAAIGTNLAGAGGGGASSSYIISPDGSGVVFMSDWVVSTGAGELPFLMYVNCLF